MRTLYDIQFDHVLFDQLDELLERTGGEITDEVQQLMDSLGQQVKDSLDDETERKCENYCKVIFEQRALSKARRDEAKRLERSADIADAKADWLQSRLLQFMQTIERTDLKAGIFQLRRQVAGGVAPLQITGEVPPEYQISKTVTSNDNAKIRAEIDAGKELGFAQLGERKQLLKIR
jgi:hypothetical protein